VLWRRIFERKWDTPHGPPAHLRAEHLARKRLLARLRVLPSCSQVLPYEQALQLALRCAPVASHVLALASSSQHFELSRATLARVPTLRYLAAAAGAGSQWTGEHARIHAQGGADVRADDANEAVRRLYAAFGAAVLRCGCSADAHAAAESESDERRVGDALYRFASFVAARVNAEAGAALCARAALAAAPPALVAARAAAASQLTPAAGRWPAGARPPHDSASARARREARPTTTAQLLSGSWLGARMHVRREGQQPPAAGDAEPLTIQLGLNVTHDGRVSGHGRDALGTFTLTGSVHAPPVADTAAAAAAAMPALTRLSLVVSYRECGGLPGALIAHTVPGAAPMSWEGYVWPFGLVGAWAHEAQQPGAPARWAQGGTWLAWPHDSGGALM
jgi:hypothetical protein